MTKMPVLFFHSVDADNLNAQSNNTKEILARWDATDLPAVAFYFHEPDPRIVRNSNVRLIKLPSNRLWKLRALVAGLGSYSGVVYPGLAVRFDERVRRVRKFLNRGGVVVTTLEGLPVNADKIDVDESRLGEIAGHRVYGQSIGVSDLAALKNLKSQADLIISISPFLQRMASHIWPQPLSASIPLGVNIDVFNSSGRTPHGTNRRVRVVCAGSFQLRKRPSIFLDLARQNLGADFTWYGDGELRKSLLEQVRRESIRNVFFPGPLKPNDLADAFRAADVFVLPSLSEGVPKVTQEAAACGLPVICMSYYEPPSVKHSFNGFLSEDDETLFTHTGALIADVELRRRMGTNSEKMAQSWSWDTLAPRWQDAICRTVNRAQGVRQSDLPFVK